MTNAKRILAHILNYEAKKNEAPCSADTHLNQAIYLLSLEVEDTSGFTKENLDRIEDAIEELSLLRE